MDTNIKIVVGFLCVETKRDQRKLDGSDLSTISHQAVCQFTNARDAIKLSLKIALRGSAGGAKRSLAAKAPILF